MVNLLNVKKIFSLGLLISSLVLIGLTGNVSANLSVADKNINLSWKVSGDKLDISIKAKTDGWIGFGLEPSKGMKDAFFVIGFMKDGKAVIDEHYGVGLSQHKLITSLGGKESVTNKVGKKEGAMTTFSFTLPLKSNDNFHKNIDLGKDTTVLLAFSDKESLIRKHNYFAIYSVNFKSGTSKLVKAK